MIEFCILVFKGILELGKVSIVLLLVMSPFMAIKAMASDIILLHYIGYLYFTVLLVLVLAFLGACRES